MNLRIFLLLSFSFIFVLNADTAPLERIQVRNAVTRHAVCNDGSPAVYYYRPGTGEGSNRWILFLAGGGFCYSATSCKERAASSPELMTSTDKPETLTLDGLLSDEQEKNPDFFNANHVVLPYCSSDLWSGNRAKSDASGGFEYRGKLIFRSVVRDLERKSGQNLAGASQVLLSGTSAGGIGTMIHADWLSNHFPGKEVRALNDAGWTPDRQLLRLLPFSDEFLRRAIDFWNGSPDRSCALQNPGALFHCYSSEVYPHLQTPLFVQMSQNDAIYLGAAGITYPFDVSEQIIAGLFAVAIRSSLDPVQGAFSPRTFTHGTLPYTRFYELTINGHSLREVLGNWFFHRNGPVKVIR